MKSGLISFVCLGLSLAIMSVECRPAPEYEYNEDKLARLLDDNIMYKLRPVCREDDKEELETLDEALLEPGYQKVLKIIDAEAEPLSELAHRYYELLKMEREAHQSGVEANEESQDAANGKTKAQQWQEVVEEQSQRLCALVNVLYIIALKQEVPESDTEKTYDIPKLRGQLSSDLLVNVNQQCQAKSTGQLDVNTIRSAYDEMRGIVNKKIFLDSEIRDGQKKFMIQLKKVGEAKLSEEIINEHSGIICGVLKELIDISESLDMADTEEISSPSQ